MKVVSIAALCWVRYFEQREIWIRGFSHRVKSYASGMGDIVPMIGFGHTTESKGQPALVEKIGKHKTHITTMGRSIDIYQA